MKKSQPKKNKTMKVSRPKAKQNNEEKIGDYVNEARADTQEEREEKKKKLNWENLDKEQKARVRSSLWI